MKNIFTIITLFSATYFLVGCQDTNKLKKMDPSIAARFLVYASASAEKKLNIYNRFHRRGYQRCVEEQETASLCNRLYSEMLAYAKTQDDFKGITLSNLKDKTLWKSIQEDYPREVFNYLD